MSVDVYSEWRSLTWPDDASDVPVVLWALLPVRLPLMTTPKPPVSLLPPETWEKVAQAHGKPSSRGSPFSAVLQLGVSRGGWTSCSPEEQAQHGRNARQPSRHPLRHVPWYSLPSPRAIADPHLLICYFGECLLCTPINVIALFCWRECRSPCHK